MDSRAWLTGSEANLNDNEEDEVMWSGYGCMIALPEAGAKDLGQVEVNNCAEKG